MECEVSVAEINARVVYKLGPLIFGVKKGMGCIKVNQRGMENMDECDPKHGFYATDGMAW